MPTRAKCQFPYRFFYLRDFLFQERYYTHVKRRSILLAAGAAPFAGLVNDAREQSDGRLKQSAARWCYRNISLDDLCKNAARMGLKGIDLLNHEDWPTVQKYGLVPAMTPSTISIPNGWNRKENHEKLERETHENIERAAEAKPPNVIVMSGNRRRIVRARTQDKLVASPRP